MDKVQILKICKKKSIYLFLKKISFFKNFTEFSFFVTNLIILFNSLGKSMVIKKYFYVPLLAMSTAAVVARDEFRDPLAYNLMFEDSLSEYQQHFCDSDDF